jgi:ribosomal protein L13E
VTNQLNPNENQNQFQGQKQQELGDRLPVDGEKIKDKTRSSSVSDKKRKIKARRAFGRTVSEQRAAAARESRKSFGRALSEKEAEAASVPRRNNSTVGVPVAKRKTSVHISRDPQQGKHEAARFSVTTKETGAAARLLPNPSERREKPSNTSGAALWDESQNSNGAFPRKKTREPSSRPAARKSVGEID